MPDTHVVTNQVPPLVDHNPAASPVLVEALIDQPLMRNVLADLAVEAETATIVAMRMAGATDGVVRGDECEALLRRIGLAARSPADRHLGRVRQCQRAGHLARHGNSAGLRRGALRRTG